MARKIALILGLFVALLPYLGFPEDVDTVLYTGAGLVIAFLAWSGKRPAPTSSLEDMEGELRDAAHGDHHHGPSEESSSEPSPQTEENAPKTEVANTTVSVSFAKQRSRNLKKRITQEGDQPST
jgi:hypothetical protein